MKRVILLFALALLFAGCATLHEPAGSLLMNSAQKIQSYKEAINHYNFLIEQEELKIQKAKVR